MSRTEPLHTLPAGELGGLHSSLTVIIILLVLIITLKNLVLVCNLVLINVLYSPDTVLLIDFPCRYLLILICIDED